MSRRWRMPRIRTGRPLGTVLILMTLTLLTVVVPLVGLAVDGLMLYSVKTRLSAAVDAGATAAVRMLNADSDETEQREAARRVAEQFIRANFRDGYWRSHGLELDPGVVIDADTVRGRRTVDVGARVSVRPLFLRLLGRDNSVVSARSTAARRLARVVIAFDTRTPVAGRTSAPFGAIADRLSGPNGGLPRVVTGDGMAEALDAAHGELGKRNVAGALNAIVLFTGGPGQVAGRNGPHNGAHPARLEDWNTVWDMARRIRQDEALSPVVYVVGCHADGRAPDPVLLNMVANTRDPGNPGYDSSRPAGLYLPAPAGGEMARALATVASDIFRLTH